VPDPAPLSVLLVLAQSTGGIGRHVRLLAEGLPERGVSVRICAPQDSVNALGLDQVGVKVTTAPLGAGSPVALRDSRRALRGAAAGADLVHAHGLRAGADCAAFLRGHPLVVTLHNAPLKGRSWKLAHGALSRYVARSTDLTLAASDDLAADARRAGAQLVRSTFVAAPALPPPSRTASELRAMLGIGERPIVLAVGRLQRQKRLDVLIDAAAAWSADEHGPIVLIAGDGPERGALASQVAATRAPVRLLGDRRDVADLLAAATVLAIPSEWEARALVAQEAMRAGVPLVTTGVGGMRSLVGEAAVIVPVGDPDALRTALDEVISDPARRDRLSTLGQARARSWPDEAGSLDDLVETYLDLMRRMRLR
jgi:glycosyltransferase involved in cell wall biosynthesis